jgi:hypothetical protein
LPILWEYFGIISQSSSIAEIASSGELQRSLYNHCYCGLRAFMHPTLAQLPVLSCRSCHMVTVIRADISEQIAQRWNANAHYQPVGRLEAFLAYDFSKMRASFSHDFRLLMASIAAFFGSLSVAQDHVARDRITDRLRLEFLTSLAVCSHLILHWSRRLGSRGFSNQPICRRCLGSGYVVSSAFSVDSESGEEIGKACCYCFISFVCSSSLSCLCIWRDTTSSRSLH